MRRRTDHGRFPQDDGTRRGENRVEVDGDDGPIATEPSSPWAGSVHGRQRPVWARVGRIEGQIKHTTLLASIRPFPPGGPRSQGLRRWSTMKGHDSSSLRRGSVRDRAFRLGGCRWPESRI